MKFSNHKKIFIFILPLILVMGIFFIGNYVYAGIGDWPTEILSGILGVFIWALGLILVLVIEGLVYIASYQNFIGSQAVTLGWVVVRDISNMFFVVVLMIIAFGTILHLENYNYKKWLPKLILMAILINFSKTICGLLIDVAQVAMLTFVNAFKDIGGANLTDMLGISRIVTMAKTSDSSFSTIVGAYFLGVIYLIVAIVVITTMMAILVMRLVMIWIYVVLSPIAYLLAAFPGGQKYASQWWSEFTKNLIVGPVLAFFIWLSLASLSGANNLLDSNHNLVGANNINKSAQGDINKIKNASGLEGSNSISNSIGVEASTPSALIAFVIGIGMLIGGLKISQEIGGAAGSIAGKGMGALQKGVALSKNMGVKSLKGLGKVAFAPVNYGVDKLQHKTGFDLNLKRAWTKMQDKRKSIKAQQYQEGQTVAAKAMNEGGIHGILAMTGNAGDAYEQMTSWKGIKKRFRRKGSLDKKKAETLPEQEEAKKEFEEAKFQDDFVQTNPTGRTKTLADVKTKQLEAMREYNQEYSHNQELGDDIKTEEAKGQYKDEDKLRRLQADKTISGTALKKNKGQVEVWRKYEDFASKNQNRKFTSHEEFDIRVNKQKKEKALDKVDEKLEKYTPDYTFEARSNEQELVGKEMSKIKDISDPGELGRILKNAISQGNKTLVKATMLKMTKDSNDNEALQPLVGDTSWKGVQDLMRQLSTKGSKNYANFNQQEAFGLGSQIAEINKTTNHWAATSAYTMDNGKFRETTDKEHNHIFDVETGKMQLQAFLRNVNRLGYGQHDSNGAFHLNHGGVMKLISIDNKDGHDNMKTMNENAAKYVYDAIMKDPNLKARFNTVHGGAHESLLARLEQRLGELAKNGSTAQKDKAANDLGYK